MFPSALSMAMVLCCVTRAAPIHHGSSWEMDVDFPPSTYMDIGRLRRTSWTKGPGPEPKSYADSGQNDDGRNGDQFVTGIRPDLQCFSGINRSICAISGQSAGGMNGHQFVSGNRPNVNMCAISGQNEGGINGCQFVSGSRPNVKIRYFSGINHSFQGLKPERGATPSAWVAGGFAGPPKCAGTGQAAKAGVPTRITKTLVPPHGREGVLAVANQNLTPSDRRVMRPPVTPGPASTREAPKSLLDQTKFQVKEAQRIPAIFLYNLTSVSSGCWGLADDRGVQRVQQPRAPDAGPFPRGGGSVAEQDSPGDHRVLVPCCPEGFSRSHNTTTSKGEAGETNREAKGMRCLAGAPAQCWCDPQGPGDCVFEARSIAPRAGRPGWAWGTFLRGGCEEMVPYFTVDPKYESAPGMRNVPPNSRKCFSVLKGPGNLAPGLPLADRPGAGGQRYVGGEKRQEKLVLTRHSLGKLGPSFTPMHR